MRGARHRPEGTWRRGPEQPSHVRPRKKSCSRWLFHESRNPRGLRRHNTTRVVLVGNKSARRASSESWRKRLRASHDTTMGEGEAFSCWATLARTEAAHTSHSVVPRGGKKPSAMAGVSRLSSMQMAASSRASGKKPVNHRNPWRSAISASWSENQRWKEVVPVFSVPMWRMTWGSMSSVLPNCWLGRGYGTDPY